MTKRCELVIILITATLGTQSQAQSPAPTQAPPVTPATAQSATAQPVTAQPATAQPVTAQPVKAQPAPPGSVPGATSAQNPSAKPPPSSAPGTSGPAAAPGVVTPGVATDPNANSLAQPPGVQDELADILEEFKYDPTGRRDPFLPYVPNRTSGVGPIGPVMPLQKYELERLRLVGVMWDVRDPRALIKTPSGDVFTIHKDTRIGNKNGYVAQIRSGEIIVIEVVEAAGRVLYQTRVIRVAKDEGKGPT